MGTQRSTKALEFHALAVSAALQLGLNTLQSSMSLPPLEQELRKRSWFWCVANDRYVTNNLKPHMLTSRRFLSMLFGRAPMIHHSLVIMESPIMTVPGGSLQIGGSPTVARSIIDHFNAFVYVIEILASHFVIVD